MAHHHSAEYQVKIVYENGAEELSGWMDSKEQVPQVMAALYTPRVKAYWLRERDVVCPECPEREQHIMEFPLTPNACPRSRPHDSRYLEEVGLKDPYTLLRRAS
jgi:hypothetical protein